jgi:uncharacterized protein YgiM (DUF1202 family)
MKVTISVVFLFVVMIFAGFKAHAQKQICMVADPTGSPLNVRSYPTNGRVVGKLRNGTVVRIESLTVDEITGKSWAKISVNRNRKYVVLGYVLDAFLNCN